MNWTRMVGALAVTALITTACAEQADTGEEEFPPAAETAPAPTTPAPAEQPMDQTLTFQPIGESQVGGDVEIRDENGQLAVDVTLQNSTEGAVHKGHIHQGTCDNPGPVVAPLEDVTVGSNGEGTSENTVTVPMDSLMNGQHIVAFHEANGNPGAPIVCAPIEAHQM